MHKSLITVRQFFIDYANSCLKDDINSIPENWQSTKCKLSIKIIEDQLEIIGFYDKHFSPLELLSLDPSKSKTKRVNIKYKGKINGYGIMFQFWEWEGGETLSQDAKIKSNGFLIINDNKKLIRIMEFGTRKDQDILEITQVK